MKKLTKRSILAVLALVLAVVTLGTTSYAWFTLGNTVIVSDIELNVQGGEGLEVSYVTNEGDEIGYVSVLSTKDLLNYLAADYDVTLGTDETFANHFEWDAVTSVDGKAFQSFSLDQEERKPDLTPISDTQTLGSGMIEFDLRFRTKAAPTDDTVVGLIWSQVTLTGEPKTWTPEKPFTSSKDETVTVTGEATYNASDAARVSITDTKATDATVVYENGISDTNTVLSNNIPNWSQGAHDYYKKVTQVDLAKTFGTGFGINGTDPYKAVETVTELPTDAVAMFTEETDSKGYYTADITIRIYIEGFDAEAFNSILSGMIKVGLQFKLKTDIDK